MADTDVIVIGGGPAGMAAAIEAAEQGLSVEIIEQRASLGGAIYRQPIAGVVPVSMPAVAAARWRDLSRRLAMSGAVIRYSSLFLGIDGDGFAMIEDRHEQTVLKSRTGAVIIATGAIERVRPRPGWELAGVSTAGGLQVMMKETGAAPGGRVLLAGSGPLLIAVAAQMARLGNPPAAIIEAGDPLRQFGAGLGLLRYPFLLFDGLSYLATVYSSRARLLRGAVLSRIDRRDGELEATITDRRGRERTIVVDRIGLHDGIRPNNFGLPSESMAAAGRPFILHAGDCREALGAVAAEADGRRAGRGVARLLGRNAHPERQMEREIAGQGKAQALLARAFAPVRVPAPLSALPDETILCRCEGRTVGDLKRLVRREDLLSAREVKHNGRFAMGLCQGRFCAASTTALMAELRPSLAAPQSKDLTGQRWPVRPVSIAALVKAVPEQTKKD